MNNTKKKKIRNYIFLALMVLINAFIIFEASLPGGLSSLHSKIFSDWFGDIINSNIEVSQDVIPLKEISIKNASGDSDIIIGTTERLDVTLEPSNVSDNDVTYKAYPEGLLNLVPSGTSVFVEAIGELNKECKVIATSNDKDVEYTFKIIDRKAPKLFKADIKNKNILVNKSELIDITLLEENKDGKINSDQGRLIRYYDPLKLNYYSDNEEVAIIELGYVKAKAIGSCNIYINKGLDNEIKIPINVINNPDPLVLPNDFIINATNLPHVYDMDFIKDHDVGARLDIKFDKENVTDTNVNFECLDKLHALVNTKGNVYGYKTAGKARIKVTSIANPSLSKMIEFDVNPVVAKNMSLKFSGKTELVVGDNFKISGVFEPFNTTNINLIASTENPDIAKVSKKGRNISVTALKAGDVVIHVHSESNPELKETLNLTFTKKLAINDDNEQTWATFIRKALGHFLLFFANGIISCLTFIFLFEDKDKYKLAKPLVGAGFVGFMSAWLSEFIQIFVKRGPSIKDVGLDFAGFMTALVIIGIIFMIINIAKKKKEISKHEEN